MKKCNKLFSLILSTALLFTAALPSSVFAEDTVNNVVWNDGDTVSGITINQDTNIVVNGTVTVENSINITGGNVSVSGGGKLMRSDTDLASNLFNISGGNVTFTDISIDGNNIEVSAYGAIGASGGNVVINDGTVIENNIKRKYGNTNRTVGGPAVCALGAAAITMNGGILQNNVSHRRGGAVYLENGAVFNMNGGTVKNNKTEPDIDADSIYGGGAFYVRNAELNIAGGSIVNNAATLYRGNGGGIYNSSYGTTRITGGYISGNTANLSGNGIYHSSKEDTTAVFEIGGGANVEDDIYLSSDNAYKYSKITSQLHSNIKFTVGDNSYDRVIAEGSNYSLTYADMAKMQVTNSDMALSLENNQIRLTQTANNTYTLYFGYDANGGDGTPESKELTITEGADYPAETVDFTVTPTRVGYTFLGWDTDKTATVPKYTAANAPQTITIDNNITLYAIWEKIPVYYEVKAISENGGTVSGGGTVKEGESITLTAAANDGYTFDGWYDGDTKVCDTAEFVVENVSANKTYTAKFTENVPVVSYLFSTDYNTPSQRATSLLNKIKNDGITDIEPEAITAVHFVDLTDYDLTNIAYSDYSASGDGSVKAWMDGTELYIGGFGKIIAGNSLTYAFYFGQKIDSITGLEMLDTSNVTDMSNMFLFCGSDSRVFTLDLGNNFDTSNVTNMYGMFWLCGRNSLNFTLNLRDNFDTSKVTNMGRMFLHCGSSSTEMTLDLGDKFDTSNVTAMNEMFEECAASSTVFTLDLGDKFNTSNVTQMQYMFFNCGNDSPVFTLDLGDNFDTSKVTGMRWMFAGCGRKSKVFTLDLGKKFNTANSTDMFGMFSYCGCYSGRTFKTLDLSMFTVSADTNLEEFASNIPVTNFIFGDGWANAVLPDNEVFFVYSKTATSVTGATPNLVSYDWEANNRLVTFTDKGSFTITATAQTGGTVSGGGTVIESGSITLTATADDGYTFDGWYDGDTRVCDTAEFVVENVTADKTYTAKFTKNVVYYTISAEVGTDGGTVSGGGKVAEGENVTLTAAANDGYTFDGWYDGDTKVCETAEFVVENVTADKTYTAKFTKNPVVDPDPTFDFTSLRTLKTKNITVNHETKTIDIDAADDAEYITIFVYQKDVIPGGTFKMASYMGNKVVYDKNGSYRIYFVHNFTVPVKANITINGITEQYLVNVNFDASKAKFDFTSLKGENFSNITVNHDEKTVHITANDSADDIILYVNQHGAVYGGKLRMASYLGNKVTYNPSGVYTIYANGKNSVSVKTNITINGVTEQYLITVDFPSVVWGFDTVNAENVKNVSIDHENKVITLDVNDNCDNLLLYIDQICQSNIKGQIWMKSYLGNKVVYNASDRTYTITKKDKNSITVKTKITMLGETRYYDININFTENN